MLLVHPSEARQNVLCRLAHLSPHSQRGWHINGEYTGELGRDLGQTVTNTLNAIGALGCDGGLVAISAAGEIVSEYNSDGLKCASVKAGEAARVTVFTPYQ